MDRIIQGLVFFVVLTGYADAGIKPLARFFKILPESESHTFSGSTRDHDFNRESIKVLVWNVKKTSMRPWQSEFLALGKDKDLFLIQEAYQNELFNSTLNTFENVRWDMGISFLYRRYNDTATGNMLGSRIEPSMVRVMHTPDYEPVVSTPKVTTAGKYAIEGSNRELLVISIHGINITSFATFKRHMDQAKAMIETHDGPILFAGDFNTRTKARMKHLMNLTKSLGLKTVDFKNGECRMKFKFTPHYLDHSFVRGLTVKNSEVDCNARGSDHKPMLMELAVAE